MASKFLKLFLSLNIIFLSGCSPSSNENENNEDGLDIEDRELPVDVREEKALYDEVMEVHDKAMPEMNMMMKLRGDLQVKLDLLLEEGTDTTEIVKIKTVIGKLESADHAMMNWMRKFEPKDNDSITHEEVMGYYAAQKDSISNVYNLMLTSMSDARDILGGK